MGNHSDSSEDEKSYRSKFEKLNRHNWATWKPRFENIITAKGYEDLMKQDWVAANKKKPEYRQMTAWAMNKLYATVRSEFHPILASHEYDLYGAFEALAGACGEKSIIRLCDKLYTMINTTYQPGSSLGEHLTMFRKNYTALTSSIAANPGFMTVSTGMAAAILLRSFHLEESLTPLIQSLYDLKPLTFDKVFDRISIEETRQSSQASETVFHLNQGRRLGKKPTSAQTSRPFNNSRGSTTRGRIRGVTPTRPAPKGSDDVSEEFAKMFKSQMKKYMAGQANLVEENLEYEEDQESDDKEYYVDDPEDTGFMIDDEAYASGDMTSSQSTTLIFDSGASKSTLCDFRLLIDPKPVTKAINTYSGSISITHVGKFNMGGTLIYPVFFAPNGPRNLISASQLEDHGLRVIFKNRLILVRLGQKIVYRFPRVGNLYQGLAPRTTSGNYALAVSEPSPDLDYHILLGHPSDEYLRQFYKLYDITPTDKARSALNCEVCRQCKLKRAPHSNPLPSADRPFKTLHMDVLQISPPSKTSIKYILVIIDDYSRFNRIYLMKTKSESEIKIMSFINEIVNKTGKCPAIIHTDRGGEFNSSVFRSNLEKLGITVEAGPANSPQTNGLAERFNQTLLVKIRCLLAQSSVPINYWDEAAKYASTLINILPSKALNWSSPVNVLSELNLLIEPVRDFNKLIPFGLKVYVNHRPPSKVLAPSRPLICLGYEHHSDAMRFFDPSKRHIVISRDYTPTKLNFPYNSPNSLTKPLDTLPKAISSSNPFSKDYVILNNPTPHLSVTPSAPSTLPSSNPPAVSGSCSEQNLSVSQSNTEVQQQPDTVPPSASNSTSRSVTGTAAAFAKNWTYVPVTTRPTREISSKVDPANIVHGPRRTNSRSNQRSARVSSVTDPPDEVHLLQFDLPEYVFLTETVSVKTALNNPSERKNWEEAMTKEFDSLASKNTGTLVPPPGDDKVIGGMWLLGRKKNEFGEILRFKARWVCFGNHQVHMLHYFDTYASVARNESFKLLLTIAVAYQWAVFQFDVETAFLYGEIDAPIYVAQVEGFEQPGKENWVWRLNKSLYGTKQAPRQWRKHLVGTLTTLKLSSSPLDESLFYNDDRSMYLHMHVDDGFIIGCSRDQVLKFLEALKKTYTMKVQERPAQHLGYTLDWKEDGSVHVHQSDFAEKILYEFNMTDANPVKAPAPMNLHKIVASVASPINQKLYQKAVGMLNYLALHTRPDITFVTNLLAQFTSNPNEAHWSSVKHLLRYLKGTMTMGIHYIQSSNLSEDLVGWADADYATSLVTKKSTSGYVITLFGNPVCWSAKKQPVVAQSTTEAEFVAINRCAKQLRWLTNLILNLHIKIKPPTLKNDNSGAVIISKEAQLNENTKHIEIRFQYVLELVLKKQLIVQQVSTNDMIADGLTKPLGFIKLAISRQQLHLTESELRRSVVE